MKRVLLCAFAVATLVPAFGAPAAAVTGRPILIRHISHAATTSTNWSGYAAYRSGTTFTNLKGRWVQPTAHCNTRGPKYSSFWVGIDGYKSSSVEQTGTEANCNGKGNPVYYAWYEMYPASSVKISNFPVHPGDTIAAEVSASGNTFTLTITNVTTGKTFSTQQTQSGLDKASAEWVAEAPSLCFVVLCQVQKLTDFGTVNFSGSYTTASGHTGSISDGAWSHDKITMTTLLGAVKAQPSGLSSNGTAFSVTWKHA